MEKEIEGMEIKVLNTTIDIIEQPDCMAVVRRVWNPYSETTETTAMIIGKDTFVAMFDPMAEAVNYAK